MNGGDASGVFQSVVRPEHACIFPWRLYPHVPEEAVLSASLRPPQEDEWQMSGGMYAGI